MQWGRPRFDPHWEDPLEKGMATTPVFFPGEFHGQRSLAGYKQNISIDQKGVTMTSVKQDRYKDTQFSSVPQSCLTLCNRMDCSTLGLPVHHKIPELTQTHVHRVGDTIQLPYPLSSPSPPTFNHSEHQGLFQ